MDSQPVSSTATQSDIEYNANSSNARIPPDAQKKRKYEEATHDEKWELYQYHSSHPHLKQRELAEWFKTKFQKQINQSTVSRNLRKFNISPPAKSGVSPKIPSKKRERKQSCTLLLKSVQNPDHLKFLPAAVSLPPTPPPRDSRQSPIDARLWEFYINRRRTQPRASDLELTEALKTEAQNLFASILPPQSAGKCDQQIIDDEWICSWKRNHGIPPPSPSFSEAVSLQRPIADMLPKMAIVSDSVEERTSSEETEPRSPVSQVSTIANRGDEHPPMKALLAASETHSHLQRCPDNSGSHPENIAHESSEKQLKKEIRKLSREVQKRELRIKKETVKLDDARRRLADFENDDAVQCVRLERKDLKSPV